MTADEQDPKERILQAAIAILGEEADPESITVRQIAARAEVGTGLINYHFGSKDALLNDAIGALMQAEIGPGSGADLAGIEDPVEGVRMVLKQTSHAGMRFPKLLALVARQALLSGDYGPERTLLPLLRAHYDGALDEPDIRLTAIQLVAPLQVIGVRSEDVQRFTGVDVTDPVQLDAVIDRLVDNILK
jgi:AcrR family transcriptional regulator